MKSHNLTLDILKVIMAFMVVALHRELYIDCNEILGNMVDALVHLAVPTFFIINGFYFASVKKMESFKKTLKRWSVLYLTWTFIYGYFIVLYSSSLQVALMDVFMGYFHLWYIVNTIYAFVIVWLITKWGGQKWLLFISALSAVLGVIFAYNGVGDRWYRNFLFFALPFITIGYLINKKDIRLKRSHSISLLCVGLIMNITEYYIAKTYMGVARMELGVSLYFVCPILFLICNNSKLTYGGKFLADFSTGIYLTHQLVLPFIDRIPILSQWFVMNSLYRTLTNILVAGLLTLLLILHQKRTKIKLL